MRFSLSLLLAVLCSNAVWGITIETVPVGDVGNANDPATGNLYGGVSYEYRIGKYEVTVGQYTAFLNAVAADDPYRLYNTRMAMDLNAAGIARDGAPGSYTYSVIGSPNHPVTYVNVGDAARFSNWLHNGQPTGAQGPGTTETGAYTLEGATEASPGALLTVTRTRNAAATWFIPTESEWYKAAYYQPAAKGGDSDSYWLYAMRNNEAPYSDQPPGDTPDNTRVANFQDDDNLANGYNDGYAVTGSPISSDSQNYLTDAGAYTSSSSFYGTYDQTGNVWECIQTATDFLRRGGSWVSILDSDALTASGRTANFVSGEGDNAGFRVATVPEPSTLLLTIAAFATLLTVRR